MENAHPNGICEPTTYSVGDLIEEWIYSTYGTEIAFEIVQEDNHQTLILQLNAARILCILLIVGSLSLL